ncbi:DUF4007 family protein [Megamonas funiformis]|uniref:DUF4007 family protein n=1 Tax=Megamonas funiformis TaxID=437897 RepID=UPI00242D6336|nr:DUF4007 family protein [Megamonas funiformis]
MKMKFRAHDTFFIRKGWLNKGMKYVYRKPNVFVDKNENPMDILGIGANMVKSLRYWLQVVGLTEENKSGQRIQTLTDLGKSVFVHDRYIEELGTLHLLQYKLATNKENATAWYFFFNEFFMSEFTKEDFVRSLENFVLMNDENFSVALRSLNDDFLCIVNTYLSRYKTHTGKISPENNIDCPLGELGLIDILNKEKKIYRKTTPIIKDFDPWIILAIIIEQSKGKREINLNDLLIAPFNIGRIFNLDSISLLELLHKVEKIGEIKIIRTAGLDVIRINNDRTFQECIEIYYKNIEI